MQQEKPSILITGGAGFLGSTLVRKCLEEKPWSVVILDKLTYAGHRCNLAEVIDNPRYELVEGDINDVQLVAKLLKQHRPAAIIHLAAETHVDRSIGQPPQFATTNVLGTCTLLDVAVRHWQQLEETQRRAFRFLQVSTDEVFGSAAANEKFDEESRLEPNSPYAASKAAGEHFVRAFSKTYGMPLTLVNPSNNYGPRQYPEKLIPKMILNAAQGLPLPLYGDGLHQRDWLHVEDCCDALLEIVSCRNPSERYLIGADNCLSNLQVVETICDLVDDLLAEGPLLKGMSRRKLIESVSDRPGHDRRYAVDAQLLRNETNWYPRIGFEEGLRDTVRWYLDHPEWVSKVCGQSKPK